MRSQAKLNILYIAKNIPTPQKKTNRIVFDIAHHLSGDFNIDFLFPKEIVPFWLKNNPRFAYLYKLKKWTFEGFEILSIPYIKLPFQLMQYWPLCCLPRKLKLYVKKNGNPDLVHAHYLFPDGYMAYLLFKKYGIPYVLTFRNQDKQYLELLSPNNMDYKKAKRIINSASQVLVPNGGYQEFVESTFNVVCTIIPHGIEKEVFQQEDIANIKEFLSILSVADGLKTKNVDWVIRAFRSYRGNQLIKLFLAGDVCKREDIIELSQEDDRILLLGKIPRENVLKRMKEGDIFALPSCKETFGLVYLEAAATRNAIIGYKNEGVWGVFEDNKEMLFCSGFEQFETQLHRLIDDDKQREMLVQNSYEKATSMTWKNVQNRYKEVYQNALKKNIE